MRDFGAEREEESTWKTQESMTSHGSCSRDCPNRRARCGGTSRATSAPCCSSSLGKLDLTTRNEFEVQTRGARAHARAPGAARTAHRDPGAAHAELEARLAARCARGAMRSARRARHERRAHAQPRELGLDAPQVQVEAHLGRGLPNFTIVGLPAPVVRESRERVRAALINSGFEFPQRPHHGQPGAGGAVEAGRPLRPADCAGC